MGLLSILALTAVGMPLMQKAVPPDVTALPRLTELPDPLVKPDGTRITSRRAWASQRRALLESVLRYEYGALPPVPQTFTGKEMASRTLEAVSATEHDIRLTIGSSEMLQTRLVLTLPATAKAVPVIVCGDLCWGRVKPEIVAEVVKRGYALAEFDRTEIAPDSAERGGIYAVYPDYHGGRLAAWAWGYHRVVDYLLSRKEIDRKRIIATGHSRGGKATLLAGAADERIALTAPNNSGCGGAGCYRLQAAKSEDIGAILKNFPFWFEPNFGKFIGQVERLPFDQHTVKALIAPRALLTTEALGDLWANPYGTQQTHVAARDVFRFLGAEDRIGIIFRLGGHEHNLADWQTLLDFADKQLFQRPMTRRFDTLAFPD